MKHVCLLISLLLLISNSAFAANCDNRAKLKVTNNSSVKLEITNETYGSIDTIGYVMAGKRKTFPNSLNVGVRNIRAYVASKKAKGYDLSNSKVSQKVLVVNQGFTKFGGFSFSQTCKKTFKLAFTNKDLNIQKQSKNDSEEPSNFGGFWKTNFGNIVFAQFSPELVTATYFWNGGGTLTGSVKKRVLSGTYNGSAGPGTFSIKISKNGKKFSGSYKASGSGFVGAWTGSR